jgi:hypothetical protein
MKTLYTDNVNGKPIAGMQWRKTGYAYMVRSDAGGLNTSVSGHATLKEARKDARYKARHCGWSEIFRWSENGVMIKPVLVAIYEYRDYE